MCYGKAKQRLQIILKGLDIRDARNSVLTIVLEVYVHRVIRKTWRSDQLISVPPTCEEGLEVLIYNYNQVPKIATL